MPEARAKKRLESVLVVIYTRALECLLLERARPAGFWQSVTGSLRWAETPAECAAREVREETGLDPAGLRDAQVQNTFPILPEWRARYGDADDTNLEHVWYLELPAPREIVLAANEHVSYTWLPIDAAISKVSSWTNREALERLRAGAAPR